MRTLKVGKLSSKSGFTLIELIIVLFILAMMLGIVAPKVISGLYNNTQGSILRKLNSAIIYARNQAMLERQNWVLRLDLEKSSYCLNSQKEITQEDKSIEEQRWKSLEPLSIRDVQDEEGKTIDTDVYDIIFNFKGLARPSIIHITDSDNRDLQTLRLKAFNRKVQTYPGYVTYEDIFFEE